VNFRRSKAAVVLEPELSNALCDFFEVNSEQAKKVFTFLRSNDLSASFTCKLRQLNENKSVTYRCEASKQQQMHIAEHFNIIHTALRHKEEQEPHQQQNWNFGFDDSDERYCGDIPAKPLKFGEYLYYSGFITRRHLLRLLEWQKVSRPLFGQIAISKSFLTPHQFALLLTHLPCSVPIGDKAVELGYLQPEIIPQIIHEQQRYQIPIGEICIENGMITQKQRDTLLQQFYQHQQIQGS